MILIDWKNVGEAPVSAFHASIKAYDDDGVPNTSIIDDTCVYAAEDGTPGMAHGETYREPKGSGHVLTARPDVPGIRRGGKVGVGIVRAK